MTPMGVFFAKLVALVSSGLRPAASLVPAEFGAEVVGEGVVEVVGEGTMEVGPVEVLDDTRLDDAVRLTAT
jgi:hypothetical protein